MPDPQPSDLESALLRVTSPPILGVLGALLALGTAAVHVCYLASRADPAGQGGESGTGDFLAFFTGATLIAEGRGAALYDFAAQAEVQTTILGGPVDWFQGYLNPPLLAAVLAPFVRWGFVPTFFAFDALSVGAFVAAAVALAPALPNLAPRPGDRLTVFALIYACPAVARVLVGGQNTAITLALLAGIFAASRAGRPIVAGVLLGLLSYKPQYAVLLGLGFLWRGDLRLVGAGGVVGLLHYTLGAWLVGPTWPRALLVGMAEYGPKELAANGATHFSWVRAVDYAAPAPVDTLLTIAGLVGVGAAVWRAGRSTRAEEPTFGAWYALLVTASMLVSPHLQYYDVGVLVLPVLLLAEDAARRGPLGLGARLAVAAAWGAAPAWVLAPRLGFQPLTLLLVATFGVAAVAAGSGPRRT